MLPLTSGGSSFTVALANEQATERLVTDIAAALEPGDLVTLSGDLGAGKTTFARAMIRYLADNPDIPVPSPTFTLIQTYDLPRFPVVHADLYRLKARANSPSSASTTCPRTPWCCWNGRTGRPDFCRRTASTSPSRSIRRPGPKPARRGSPAMAPSRRARSASRRCAAFWIPPATARPNGGASRATPRRAPTSGSSRASSASS